MTMTADAAAEPEAPPLLDFEVDVAALSAAVARVKPAVASKRLPILRGVKITGTTYGAKLTASDLDLALIARVHFNGTGTTHTEGDVVLDHVMLSKFLAKAKNKGILRVTANGEDEVTLSVGKVKVRVRPLPIDDFPKIARPNDRSLELNTDALADVLIAASTDDARPILTGVAVERGSTYVATDSYRLHVMETGTEDESIATILIPRRVAALLAKIGGTHTASVGEDGHFTRITTPDVTIVCRLIDGQFPNWRSLIPVKPTTIVTFRNEAFADALSEVIEMAGTFTTVGPTTGRPVAITQADPDALLLTLKDNQSSVEITTPGHLSGTVESLGFNPVFLRDLFKGTSGNEMVGIDNLKPVLLIEQTDMGTRKRLIMPVRA